MIAAMATLAMIGRPAASRVNASASRHDGKPPTSVLQKFSVLYPPKADVCGAARDVRFGPIADMGHVCVVPAHRRINERCRVRPMLAQSNEWCRQVLSADWPVCGHAMRRAAPQKATCSSPALVPDRQEMASSNRQSS